MADSNPVVEKTAAAATVPLAKLRAWLELCRIPNCFTAMADPLAGALIVGVDWTYTIQILSLMLASACLYTGGIVLNDWHDYANDLRERPERPLPSGRIRRWQALPAAMLLFAFGLIFAAFAGDAALKVALLIFVAALAYDTILKEVPIAPVVMGACRMLNLLMGMVLAPIPQSPVKLELRCVLLLIMTVYVTGITIFARREARPDQWQRLMYGAITVVCPIIALTGLKLYYPAQPINVWGKLLPAALLTVVGFFMTRAVLTPRPEHVQTAVKIAVLGIVALDASCVAMLVSIPAALIVLLLLAPAVWLGRWIYST